MAKNQLMNRSLDHIARMRKMVGFGNGTQRDIEAIARPA